MALTQQLLHCGFEVDERIPQCHVTVVGVVTQNAAVTHNSNADFTEVAQLLLWVLVAHPACFFIKCWWQLTWWRLDIGAGWCRFTTASLGAGRRINDTVVLCLMHLLVLHHTVGTKKVLAFDAKCDVVFPASATLSAFGGAACRPTTGTLHTSQQGWESRFGAWRPFSMRRIHLFVLLFQNIIHHVQHVFHHEAVGAQVAQVLLLHGWFWGPRHGGGNQGGMRRQRQRIAGRTHTVGWYRVTAARTEGWSVGEHDIRLWRDRSVRKAGKSLLEVVGDEVHMSHHGRAFARLLAGRTVLLNSSCYNTARLFCCNSCKLDCFPQKFVYPKKLQVDTLLPIK